MTEFDWTEAGELHDKLREYADFEMSSHSEMICALCDLSHFPDYMSQDLWDAVMAAMKDELKNYTENTRIVTKTETITREVADLEWINE